MPLRYKNLVKQWVPRDIPQVSSNFFVNERIYRISLSSFHGLGLFFMDGIKVGYDRCIGSSYNYNDWMHLVQYK